MGQAITEYATGEDSGRDDRHDLSSSTHSCAANGGTISGKTFGMITCMTKLSATIGPHIDACVHHVIVLQAPDQPDHHPVGHPLLHTVLVGTALNIFHHDGFPS